MRQLQSNFTTPEQSKRLLELGLPTDSADMYYFFTELPPSVLNNGVLFSSYAKTIPEEIGDIIPCWSVGRLIEIMRICYRDEHGYMTLSLNSSHLAKKSLVERCIFDIENKDKFDFSKLEE